NESHPGLPWSVRNQARMHLRNGDQPYHSTLDAMRYWLEKPTAVAVRINRLDQLEILAPFGLDCLIGMRGEPTPRGLEKYDQYLERMHAKNWPATWPKVRVRGLSSSRQTGLAVD
ncbi:MAG: nucleotidyltransferase family protein, partial [Pseudomonadota bacterium]